MAHECFPVAGRLSKFRPPFRRRSGRFPVVVPIPDPVLRHRACTVEEEASREEATMQQRLWTVLEGAAGGAAGTFLLTQALKLEPRLPEALRSDPPSGDPAEFIVERAERLAGRRLPERAHRALARSAAWTYGTGWAVLLGLLGPRLRMRKPGRALAIGAGLGAAVWAVGYAGWMPAAGLVPPIQRQRRGGIVSGLLGHVLYGMVSALPIYVGERIEDRRRTRFLSRLIR
jgi:hypothetical protein